MDDERRYAELPRTVRAFLETLDDQSVVRLANLLRFYEEMPEESRVFLLNAKSRTLQWLKEAREDEIEQINDGIRLVQSLRTGGRFVKWLVITAVAALLGAAALSKSLSEMWHWVRGP